jgi:hypothetical protein
MLEDAVSVLEKALYSVCMQDCVQKIEWKGQAEHNKL